MERIQNGWLVAHALAAVNASIIEARRKGKKLNRKDGESKSTFPTVWVEKGETRSNSLA